MSDLLDEAARRLELTLGLSAERERRAVLEVLDVMRFDVDAYIAARHAPLQTEGLTNAEICHGPPTSCASSPVRPTRCSSGAASAWRSPARARSSSRDRLPTR